jgi:hypothetical protein
MHIVDVTSQEYKKKGLKEIKLIQLRRKMGKNGGAFSAGALGTSMNSFAGAGGMGAFSSAASTAGGGGKNIVIATAGGDGTFMYLA